MAAAVVKADAYGTGMAQAAPALVQAGCDTFFVARLEEGIALRPLVPEARIFVLDGAQPDAVPALISHRLTPVLNSTAEIAGWSAAARATRTRLDAAIHIDTGMNRLGLPGSELASLAAEHVKRLEGLRLVLLMSHLACSDDGRRQDEPRSARPLQDGAGDAAAGAGEPGRQRRHHARQGLSVRHGAPRRRPLRRQSAAGEAQSVPGRGHG